MSRHHLDQLLATLLQIASLVPDSLAAWREDEFRQLAVERLWITAGNLALPGDLSEERVWYESVTDIPRLTEQVQRARG